MNSLKELIRVEEFEEKPISLKRLLQIHNSRELSARALLASHEMLTDYKKSPRWVVALGPITGGVTKDNTGSYFIPAKFGFLLKPLSDTSEGPKYGPTEAMGEYTAAVNLAGVRCFGTEDPGFLGPEEDEVYGYVTLFALLPGREEQVIVKRLPRQNNVKKGDVIYKNTPIGELNMVSGTAGLKIHMVLLDKEHLEPQNTADEIASRVKMINAAVGATASAITIRAPNKVTPIIALASAVTAALLEVDAVQKLLNPLFEVVGLIFKDDRIGEKVFSVSPVQIENWSTTEGFHSSEMRDPDLGPDISFNIPVDINNPTWLFNEGGSTYKVFFIVRTRKVQPYPIPKD